MSSSNRHDELVTRPMQLQTAMVGHGVIISSCEARRVACSDEDRYVIAHSNICRSVCFHYIRAIMSRSSCSEVQTSSQRHMWYSVADSAALLPVTEVSKAGDDVGVLVETFVDPGSDLLASDDQNNQLWPRDTMRK